ncbi:branched-chain amino acid transport system substrate-binding protein [Rhodococcus sp. PvR044]|uniref:branched-chain amino acid ABC transporter substrate-binding protein n=1 Tax=unclassified Rhodococcus (in: high G+C Gram-positive bacteria) TaxID=192944 RepID=UPI000BD56C81|nr:branched-chain amino acid ABC transporter substrate-binding protein [Rhodococcus sp. OK270]PTR39033.1 amino acid/amide ABC transporter substrate-binding protein (HAAT family) [Rhodococcus sp. OK611]SNX92819.1 amino acid/amide ABC transporter substrate-binding protein, HAAT family [Rhodococcus sp. OK270]
MHRRTARGALIVGVAAALAVAGCSSKTTDGGSSETSGTGESSALSIQPGVLLDSAGNEVASADVTDAADPAGSGNATCSGVSLAMAGALTGANAALGQNILYGAKLALDKHNQANPNCQVEMETFDTEGDPQKATQVAPNIVSNASIVGLLGPAFSGETKATGPIFNQSGLPFLTASATNPTLTENGWTTFFRGLGNDNSQGSVVAKYLTGTLDAKKVCVVQDDSDYGVGLARVVTETLGAAADPACSASVKTGQKDFSATVSQIKGESPDAIWYSGYYAEAAPFVTQLREGGVTATFSSGDGTNDPEFVKQAGESANGAVLTCPCVPAPAALADQYEALNGQAPGVYSVEGYDLTTIMLKAIDSGVKDRAGMLEYVKNYDGQGVGKKYQWNDKGELSNALIQIYKVN